MHRVPTAERDWCMLTLMLNLAGKPLLPKTRLIGGCVRLPRDVDIVPLATEFAALAEAEWESTAGRVGVHRAADAIFLRGFAPADGDRPIEDRPILARLPALRRCIEHLIDAPRMRCLLARLPPGATIAPHRDDGAPYFDQTLRVHVPLVTNDQVFMMCADRQYTMQPGEVWVLDNSAVHAVWNAHPARARTHLICDYLPSPELLTLLAVGTRGLGREIPAVDEHFASFGPRPTGTA
jgi:hypothetical protein